MGGLDSWRDSASRRAIVDFVERVTTEGGPDFVPPAERIAVFDNDGTLWCEKPMPIELGFLLRRFAEMAEQDESLRGQEPWRAAHERDLQWLGAAMTKHYHGDDADMQTLMRAILQAFADHTVEHYCAAAESYLRGCAHPTLERGLLECAYTPMIDLLDYLAANGFINYIASGGDRDFMRAITEDIYAIPPERVIGSSNALRYVDDDGGGTVSYLAEPDVFDDGPVKPVRIWSRIGRRPILAAGNSNGDVPTLRFAGGAGRPALRMLVDHDDAEREFAYRAGAERALDAAAEHGWTVVSVRDDWATVFADAPGRPRPRAGGRSSAGR
jgi:phosphoglycolate phosphatase-like HAD superfamily hydrolase